jgi:hypothetical protein
LRQKTHQKMMGFFKFPLLYDEFRNFCVSMREDFSIVERRKNEYNNGCKTGERMSLSTCLNEIIIVI